MKKVYTHENRVLVGNAQNLLEQQGIACEPRNFFAQSAIGETSTIDAWPELWIIDDTDYERACNILEHALSDANEPEWLCARCGEANDASFELCWSCGHDPG